MIHLYMMPGCVLTVFNPTVMFCNQCKPGPLMRQSGVCRGERVKSPEMRRENTRDGRVKHLRTLSV